jgi:hypothetical protein
MPRGARPHCRSTRSARFCVGRVECDGDIARELLVCDATGAEPRPHSAPASSVRVLDPVPLSRIVSHDTNCQPIAQGFRKELGMVPTPICSRVLRGVQLASGVTRNGCTV